MRSFLDILCVTTFIVLIALASAFDSVADRVTAIEERLQAIEQSLKDNANDQ